jgi:hypothetical protein
MSRIGRRRRSFDRNYPFPFFFLFTHPPEGQAAAAALADPVESAPSWTHLIFRLLLLLPPTRCLLLVAEEYELIPFCLVADETKLFLISPCMVQEQEQEIGFGEQQTEELVENSSCGIFVMRSLRIEDHGTRCRNGRRI